MCIKRFLSGKDKASANVVDGKLILSFPHAETPVVWQMDLAQVKASALEVLHDAKAGFYTLTLRTPKGETIEAAKFAEKTDAVHGLMVASKALENAHGRIYTHNNANSANENSAPVTSKAPAKQGNGGRWIVGLLCILVLVVLFGAWGAMAPQTPASFQQSSSSVSSQQQTPNPADSAGVPISADAFLSSQ